MEQSAKEIKSLVKERYGSLAREKSRSCCAPPAGVSARGDTDATTKRRKAHTDKLYTSEELGKLPTDVADFSLGCGNPTALAELSEGEVVLDLGSGGGLDCFLAAQKVGTQGKVIGLDMTPEMIQLARENTRKTGAGNVEFRLGEMEHMPLADNSVDVIISNCVINLSPDKDAVFREAYRVLKPGGRLCVSDIALRGELPEKVKRDAEAWTGCIAGALNEEVYLAKIRAAGFIKVTADREPVPFNPESETPPDQRNLRDKVASLKVKAFKPGRA